MEKSHCQTGSSQVKTIQGVDWDEIDSLLNAEKESDSVPDEDIITVPMLCFKYGVKETCARGKMRVLVASGLYEDYWEERELGQARLSAKRVRK
jgi:ribosomal protein S25